MQAAQDTGKPDVEIGLNTSGFSLSHPLCTVSVLGLVLRETERPRDRIPDPFHGVLRGKHVHPVGRKIAGSN